MRTTDSRTEDAGRAALLVLLVIPGGENAFCKMSGKRTFLYTF